MKNKITALFALFLCVCLAVCSCGADVSALENLCFAVRDFDLAKAEKYVSDSSEGYFETVLGFAEGLTEEQKEISKAIYANFSFSDFAEEDGICTVNLKYVDFSSLVLYVESYVSTGASASDVLDEMLEGGRLEKQFMKTEKGVKVTLSKTEGGVLVALGYTSENAELTRILGLDTFLRWYSLQR